MKESELKWSQGCDSTTCNYFAKYHEFDLSVSDNVSGSAAYVKNTQTGESWEDAQVVKNASEIKQIAVDLMIQQINKKQ